jgi:hypothetical protein
MENGYGVTPKRDKLATHQSTNTPNSESLKMALETAFQNFPQVFEIGQLLRDACPYPKIVHSVFFRLRAC